MARRTMPSQQRYGFQPASDTATYRDLLLFEERLKTNALMLKKRKIKYQFFLAQLIIVITLLSSEVFLETSFLSVPYRLIVQRSFPEWYSEDEEILLHPYLPLGMLFVAATTLFLFFASGMYSEKIGYANRYVVSANRALRSFNMHLNVRAPPLKSQLPFNPFRIFFPRPSSSSNSSPASTPTATPASTPSATPVPSKAVRRRTSMAMPPNKRSTSVGPVPIPAIPPTSNPRGELIFSSKVNPSFREGYERHRAVFERRREERERVKRWEVRWKWAPWNWGRTPPQITAGTPGLGGGAGSRGHSPSPSLSMTGGGGSPGGSVRGRGSRTGSPGPGASRRPSPAAHGGGRTGTPPTMYESSRLSVPPASGSSTFWGVDTDRSRSRTGSFSHPLDT